MKKAARLFLTTFGILMTFANLPLNPPGVKWEPVYNFDRCNVFMHHTYTH